MAKTKTASTQFIHALDVNGLRGRMAHLPAAGSKHAEILFLYGRHSSLEYWWNLLALLSQYGTVTAPDLPGFGGMTSFATIGRKVTLNNYADYLAALVKLRFRRKQIIIVGEGFGFIVATRMLQRYPVLAARVAKMINVNAPMHSSDERPLSRVRRNGQVVISRLLGWRLMAWLVRCVCLNHWMLQRLLLQSKRMLEITDTEHLEQALSSEIDLWRRNDLATWARTSAELRDLDNCAQRVAVPVWYVGLKNDARIDAHRLEQHLHVTFPRVTMAMSRLAWPFPLCPLTYAQAEALLPARLRRILK